MNKQRLEELIVEFSVPIMALLIVSAVVQGVLLLRLNARVEQSIETMSQRFAAFSSSTETLTNENSQKLLELSDALYNEEKQRIELFDLVKDYNRSVRKLTGTVETLEKITTTDPELLQKYSKVYFLNEHYTPSGLTAIDEEYDLPSDGKKVSVHSKVWPFLEDLLDAAKKDDIELRILSGYRSFDDQSVLKGIYTVQYGIGANRFSADQGYSEHQLGTTVDFTTSELGTNLSGFYNTKAYSWLLKNAHKYGFILSYPENNEYYQYEPWHWRFVGEDLARDLYRDKEYFYDLEQREIDTYLGTLFD